MDNFMEVFGEKISVVLSVFAGVLLGMSVVLLFFIAA
jgi:hypothetical protein